MLSRIAAAFFLLLALICVGFSIKNFWAATHLRTAKATVVASKLLVDWLPSNEPSYLITLDLVGIDDPKRTFHWEGDPGSAAYPEEAIDELEHWKPGTIHEVSMVRGNSRELRFDQLESIPELGYGFAWAVGAIMFGFVAFSFYMVARLAKDGSGVWLGFLAFGILPLLGAPFLGWGTSQKLLTWKPIEIQKVEGTIPFDYPNVTYTPLAKEKMASVEYARFEYQFQGKTYHLGVGPWYGLLDTATRDEEVPGAPNRYHVNPKDRWGLARNLTWQEDVFLPTGIVAFFGIAFTGVSLFIRKFN
jgi:hypothetical protein